MAGKLWCCGRICAALLVLASGAYRDARATAADWQARADLVFRPIAQSGDEPAMVLPTVMAQDSDGFLWAGGETGLLRWDGYRFVVYSASRVPPDGLSEHGIVALHVDAGATLWVGTLAGTLARYDAAADHFTPVPLPGSQGGAQCVWSIDDDGRGGLWVGTNEGVVRIGRDGRPAQWIRHDPARPGTLPDDHVQAVLHDRDGKLWVGGRSGLAWMAAGSMQFHQQALPTGNGDRAEVSHLMQDRAGRVWVGTRQQGAYVIEPRTGSVQRIAATLGGAAEGDGPVEIMSIAEVAPGRVWLGTFGRGIVSVEGAGLVARYIRHDPLMPRSLASDSVFSVFADHSGLAWVGTTVGISQYNAGSGGISTLFARERPRSGPLPGSPESISGFDVTSLVARPDGGLWASSEAGGIDILDPAGRNIANLPLQRVFCMLDAGGRLLAGTRDGLYLADPGGLRIARLTLPGRRPSSGVYALFRPPTDRTNGQPGQTLWLGGSDDGIWAFRLGADGQPEVVRHIDVPDLTSSVVHVIADAPGGMLAAGTENGFNLIDPVSGAVRRVQHDANDPNSLGPGGVESFATDRQGRLWVGTDTGGINVMVGRSPGGSLRFHHIGRPEGLPNMDADAMQTDAEGRIWVSTDNGLAVVDPVDFSVRALTQADGVAITAYWDNSSARTVDGTLVFGGTGGLTMVQPGLVSRWSFRPPVRITEIRLGGQPILAHAPERGSTLPWLDVPPDENAVSAEFAALDFSAPERNRYRYRLLGFDARWLETDAAHRVAAYTNLPPGDYTLQIQGSSRTGEWTDESAGLRIHALPAWYQTLWFRVAETMMLGMVVAGLVQARTLVLRRRQRQLQLLVDKRTEELRSSQQRLHEFAYVDTLTNLPNRRAFNDHLQRQIKSSGRIQGSIALVLIDLDGFKQVNDSLGHDAGDLVLMEAAIRLIEAVREGDFVARLGGDEFGIVLQGTRDMATIEAICARVVSNMAVPLTMVGGHVRIGASLGAALFPRHGDTQDELYKRADLALYAAKHAGKGAWRWYQETAAGSEPPGFMYPGAGVAAGASREE